MEDHMNGFYHSKVSGEILRYLKSPDVLSEIEDIPRMQEHYRDFYAFDRYKLTDIKTLDKDGYIVVTLGKPEYLLETFIRYTRKYANIGWTLPVFVLTRVLTV